MTVKGVLFDKDGTLMNIGDFWYSVLSRTAAQVAPSASPALQAELLRLAGFDSAGCLISESPVVSGTNRDIAQLWQEYLTRCRFPAGPDFLDQVLSGIRDNCRFAAVTPTTPHLRQILLRLRLHGCHTGIATSDDYAPTNYCLQQLGITEYMDAVFSADRVPHPKPEPDMLYMACQLWGLTPNTIIMVGDSINDMLFAARSGCTGIYLSDHAVLPPGAQHCIRSLDELPGADRGIKPGSLRFMNP